jgi:threonine dehydrogenase-like Zn-dependent dehydrogenase
MLIESKVAWLEKPYDLRFKINKLNLENLANNELFCETQLTAISPGTEIAAYTGMQPLRPGQHYPRLIGYCNVAKVIETGSQVTSVKPGDSVLTHASHCSHFVINEAKILANIPSSIIHEDAVCTYLYHLGYDAVLKSGIKYGSPTIVIGLGTLGLGAVATASNAGATVYTLSENEYSRDLALKSGAQAVYSRSELNELSDTLGGRLADNIISTTNNWADWQIALKLCGQNGLISVMGFPGRDQDSIPFNPLDSQYFYDKQLRIQAVGMAPSELDERQFLKFNQKANIEFLLQQINLKKINPKLLISGILPWNQLDNAYQRLISRDNATITYLLQWKN